MTLISQVRRVHQLFDKGQQMRFHRVGTIRFRLQGWYYPPLIEVLRTQWNLNPADNKE